MADFLEFKSSDSEIGISARKQIDGPESDMLNIFVEQHVNKLCTSKKHYALFYEPLLPTGYPDLVIVTYKPHKYESWTRERDKVGVLDLKVLHHLHFVKGATSSSIERHLGIECRLLLKILERLMDASLVQRTKRQWSPIPLSHSWGIYNIRTIEAKISDWQSAINQASMNRWFSSESFILSPVSRHSDQILNCVRTKGIGIYSMPFGTRVKTINKPERSGGLPVSYASWLFNEWIGRQLAKTRRMFHDKVTY